MARSPTDGAHSDRARDTCTIRAAAALMVAASLAITGCDGKTGTYAVTLVTAPSSHALDGVVRARMILSDPASVVEVDRAADGSFALDLDVEALGGSGFLVFEGLDASGAIVAWGRTPQLPIAAIDATLRIYVAAPTTMAAAPVALDPPRKDLALAHLS